VDDLFVALCDYRDSLSIATADSSLKRTLPAFCGCTQSKMPRQGCQFGARGTQGPLWELGAPSGDKGRRAREIYSSLNSRGKNQSPPLALE